MKNIGVVSYNIHCNFTNYGSALQSWALKEAINHLDGNKYHAKLVDYCPEILKDKDVLNPFKNMWDKDEESRKMCELSMPAIIENYHKFERFYNEEFDRTKKMYDCHNFNEIVNDEKIDAFVCGADTIFCVDEFGIDDGYYANYDCMKNGYSVSYAASFGDSHFDEESYKVLDERLKNFKALGIRENAMIDYVKNKVEVPVKKVIDPTLLLDETDYSSIVAPPKYNQKYLLLYSRRYNPKMYEYAEKVAREKHLDIIEISLRATNADIHTMEYQAGVEEFLSLVRNCEYMITNSYHGMIFSIIFKKEFVIFSREQCDTKIIEVLDMLELSDRGIVDGTEAISNEIDYERVESLIEKNRKESIDFLKLELSRCK